MAVWRSIKKYATDVGAGITLLGFVGLTSASCVTVNVAKGAKGRPGDIDYRPPAAYSIGTDVSDVRADPQTGRAETQYPPNKPQFTVPAYPGYYYNGYYGGYYGGGYYPRYNYPHVILP